MSRNKTFLPWLFSNNQKPLYFDATGVPMEADKNTLLKPNGEVAHLEDMPTGYKGIEVKYARNNKYIGMFRDFTVPLRFVRDAAKILKWKMWNEKGIENVVYFALSKLNRFTTLTQYLPWYSGELDFSKFKQDKTGVTMNVTEGGMSKYLKAFEGTTYEIPIGNNPAAVNVHMDGLPFDNNLEYIIYSQTTYNFQSYEMLGMGVILREGTSQGIIVTDTDQIQGPPTYTDNFFLKSVDKSFLLKITNGSISYYFEGSNHYLKYMIVVKNEITNAAPYSFTLYENNNEPNGSHTRFFSVNIPVSPGDNLFLVREQFGGVIGSFVITTGGGFKLNYEVTFAPTICKALRGDYVLEQLARKMSSTLYGSRSNFLTNFKNLVYTSGSAIRGEAASTLKISFDDFFKDVKTYLCGADIQNNTLIIEELSNFFQQVQTFNLGNVDNLAVEVAEDWIYNTIKVGYKNNTYDNVNGKDEFNVTQVYTTAITKTVKEYDITSPVRADMYGIELIRLNLTGKTTTDSASDNEPFKLYIETAIDPVLNAFRLYRENFAVIAGLLKPAAAFNIEFSPKRTLLRMLPFISSFLDLQTGSKITFQTGEKNSELSTLDLNSILIVEKGDLFYNPATPKLFKPYYFRFKTEVPFNYTQIMNNNPYGIIKFTYNNVDLYGYINDGAIKPAINDVQEWLLLCAPQTDLTLT